ncbi:MAG: hypothetical protein AAGE80_10370 [Pseudomonadota bacterium]
MTDNQVVGRLRANALCGIDQANQTWTAGAFAALSSRVSRLVEVSGIFVTMPCGGPEIAYLPRNTWRLRASHPLFCAAMTQRCN